MTKETLNPTATRERARIFEGFPDKLVGGVRVLVDAKPDKRPYDAGECWPLSGSIVV